MATMERDMQVLWRPQEGHLTQLRWPSLNIGCQSPFFNSEMSKIARQTWEAIGMRHIPEKGVYSFLLEHTKRDETGEGTEARSFLFF